MTTTSDSYFRVLRSAAPLKRGYLLTGLSRLSISAFFGARPH